MASEAAATMATDAAPSAMVDFLAGTVGGIASLLAGHPFDTVKTRLQAQPSAPSIPHAFPVHPNAASLAPSSTTKLIASSHHTSQYAATLTLPHSSTSGAGLGTSKVYRSATDAFRIIIREERFVGLYKGVTSPMLGVAIMNASIFGLYNLSLSYQRSHHFLESYPLTQVFIAGALSGLGSSLITSPIDLLKIRQQMHISTPTRSTWTVFTDVLRTEGLTRGLYRGWCTTAIRDLGYGPYFASYELLNAHLRSWKGTGELSNLDMAVSGGIAGVFAWVSTFWADVVKTKIQASSHLDDRGKGSLFWRTAKRTWQQGRWRGFFTGVGPTVLRAIPVNAVLFVSYEVTKDYLIRHGY